MNFEAPLRRLLTADQSASTLAAMRAVLIAALVSVGALAQGSTRSTDPDLVALPSGILGTAIVAFALVLALLWLLLPFAVFRIRRDMGRLVQLAEWSAKQAEKR